MDFISSISELVLVVVLVLNTLLAYIVFRNNHKSVTNIIFVGLSLAISFWLLIIHESSVPSNAELTLRYTRLTVFFAVPQSVLFFLLAHTLPSDKLLLKREKFYLLAFGTVLMMCLTLSPYVFTAVEIQSDRSIKSIPGPGMPLFAAFTSFFSLAAIYVLVKKIRSSSGDTKLQLVYMMRGILLMLGLIIATIMIPVMLFQYQAFIPFSPIYALIFLGTTAYAIVRFKLFDLKVIATEAFSIFLLVLFLSRIFISTSPTDIAVSVIIFITTVIFSLSLIKSVRREVKQREQLEKLTQELAAANDQLKKLDQARADFISIASHQLRTPPATMKWYLASILSDDFGEVPQVIKEQLSKVQLTNNSLIALIDDLLNVSRIERGKLEFIFEPTDLVEITQLTFDQLLPQAQDKKIKMLFVKPKTKIPNFTADKEKLRQVINNLMDNALKYTKQGEVKIEVGRDSKNYYFKVSDTGKGVPLDLKDHIFDKYDRGKISPGNSTGLGLGLYVAKVIIAQHNGKIWVESKGEGKGSTFVFTIPVKNILKNTVFDLVQDQGKIKS